MKQSILFFVCLMVLGKAFCQNLPDSTSSKNNFTKSYYSQKSKSQLIGGFILLGLGGTTIALISSGNTSLDELPILAVGGVLCVLGSIPLFIAAGRNKRKASEATAYLKMEKIPILQQTGINFHSYPAISVRLNF